MTPKQPQVTCEGKNIATKRQKRLSAALRDNLRKRKSQAQKRQESKAPTEAETEPGDCE